MSTMIFDLILRSKAGAWGITIFVFGLLFVFIPFQLLFEIVFRCTCFRERYKEKRANESYYTMRHKFLTEYDRSNPVTYRMGLKNYGKFMKGKLELFPNKSNPE